MLKRHFDVTGQARRLRGAVLSGSAAARLGVLIKALSPFTRLFDKVIYRVFSDSENKDEEIPPCLMIVSPPRSGSTIAYQVLVRAIPCVYISNLHPLFPNCASSYLLRKDLFGTNLAGFDNYYGYTSSIYDVNEGNKIVEAIFHGVTVQELLRDRFMTFVRVMRAGQERPLIFKNVRAYPHIAHLHQAVPETVFLRIRRDPEQMIHSVLRAYHEIGTFHPRPKGLVKCGINDPVEFAVRQILEIERVIDLQKKQIEKSTWLEWWYEDFCADPWPMVENLAENYLAMELSRLRRDAVPELRISKRVKVNADEAKRISLLLQQYASVKHQSCMS